MSNFRPDTGGRRWSLVQVRWFSRGAGRAGRCKQISLCVGSTHSVPATLGLPRSRVCAFPIYTAQVPGCSIWSGPCVACGSSFPVLHKSTDSVGPAFRAFPGGNSSGRQELDGRTLPGCARLLPSAGPASVSMRAGRVRLVSVLGSWALAATLPADFDHPESQEIFG